MPIKLKTPDPVATARDVLLDAGFDILEERPIDHAVQFRLTGGSVNVFYSGAVVPQGKHAAAVTRAFETGASQQPSAKAAPRSVGVVAPPQKAATLRLPSTEAETGEIGDTVTHAHRHPEWSAAPWNGIDCPFDTDPVG